MKVLKNRFIALLLTVLMVCASTFFSIRFRIEKESAMVSMGFYNGVASAAEEEPTLDAVLKKLCRVSEELISHAQQNGVPCDALKETTASLSYSLSTRSSEYSRLYNEYTLMLEELQALSSLIQTEAPNEELTGSALTEIANARQLIQNAGYNQSVRDYVSSLSKYALMFANLFDPILPEYFA